MNLSRASTSASSASNTELVTNVTCRAQAASISLRGAPRQSRPDITVLGGGACAVALLALYR